MQILRVKGRALHDGLPIFAFLTAVKQSGDKSIYNEWDDRGRGNRVSKNQ